MTVVVADPDQAVQGGADAAAESDPRRPLAALFRDCAPLRTASRAGRRPRRQVVYGPGADELVRWIRRTYGSEPAPGRVHSV